MTSCCVASSSSDGNSGGAAVRAATSQNRGIISVSSSVVQDHGNLISGPPEKVAAEALQQHASIMLVRERKSSRWVLHHRLCEPRSYLVGAGSQSIQVPGLSSATINSNSNPINSYLLQNNGDIDLSNTNGK